MIQLLERAAAASPSHPAVITSEASVSYQELLADARRIAAALRRRQITRFAVAERDAAWILKLLCGAALAGAEPCQYQADIAPDELAAEAGALGHRIVVTRRSDLTGLELLSPDQLTAEQPGPPVAASGTQPLMIRTTGTTGAPKAARHDWERLGHTVAGVMPRPDQRWLLAYGPHQFAGIQVLLHVLAAQATLIAPFPRQPADGLTALLSERVTCLSATPTYWRFLLAEARSRGVTLPPLEQITLGGEASPADLLDELRAAFPDARISHVYASTEFGSIVSVGDGRPGFPMSALFSESNPTANLRAVDGELWVRAPAGMIGYAGEPEDGPTGDADGEWRATGDLVEIVDDRVVISGRDSEVINVGGVKVHPLPVEDRIAALPRVATARVFGRPNPLTGAIVAAEVVPATGVAASDHDELRQEIQTAVADLPRASQPRVVSFVEAIETRGEKTVRGIEQ
jgi:acyl-CoA synthetase (AMP-forming)/AMP-acid ligase II